MRATHSDLTGPSHVADWLPQSMLAGFKVGASQEDQEEVVLPFLSLRGNAHSPTSVPVLINLVTKDHSIPKQEKKKKKIPNFGEGMSWPFLADLIYHTNNAQDCQS